jgi:hypothetical protein
MAGSLKLLPDFLKVSGGSLVLEESFLQIFLFKLFVMTNALIIFSLT